LNLEIVHLTLGPLPNNVYLLGDQDTGDAVVIDPSFDSEMVLSRAEGLGWTLRQVWLTHAHFDHIAGTGLIVNSFDPPLPVGLHPDARGWYDSNGGASRFGMSIPPLPTPSLQLVHGAQLGLRIDKQPVVTVKHAPGHSPGHVIFYCEPLAALFCGDVIFREGIGRTDLDGGDLDRLLKTIREEVLTLPDDTRLLNGHGPETTVGHERRHNPYLS
jgi:hydroxyacylglutathione hydrolase